MVTKTVQLPTFFKISSFVFHNRRKVIQVWNGMRVSKWWQNLWMNYLFNIQPLGFNTRTRTHVTHLTKSWLHNNHYCTATQIHRNMMFLLLLKELSFFLVFSYQFCTSGSYFTSNVVKLIKLSHHHLLLVVISVLQRYKRDFTTSIGWYINIISVIEITVFKCQFKLKPKILQSYFLR